MPPATQETAQEQRGEAASVRGRRAAPRRRERGATLIEFALVLPIFTAMMLGTISGGIAYNQKLNLSSGAREGARFGATLPVNADMEAWLASVADAVERAASPDAGPGAPGRVLCVAYVYPLGIFADDRSTKRVESGASSGGTTTFGPGDAGRCFNDGLPDDRRRVQVLATRSGAFQAFFFTRNLTLTGRATSQFEATP